MLEEAKGKCQSIGIVNCSPMRHKGAWLIEKLQ